MTQHLDSQTAYPAGEPDIGTSTRAWAKIGILSFGGPAAQIALMHRVVVDENKWLSEKQFLNALNFCMLLPGPEAMQLATYSGWRMHGLVGGLIAGLLFVIPGAIVILALAALYANYGTVPLVNAAFLGIKAAVLIIVVEALVKVSKKALHETAHYAIAVLAFIGIFFLKIPYPLIVITAALYGFITSKPETGKQTETVSVDHSFSRFLTTVSTWLAVWWAPVLLLWLTGAEAILIQISVFFSKLAVVTFGGAYAVLAYMAQDVVDAKNWLAAQEMIDGLGLAETTPGPLILVTEFVGFLAAEKVGGFWLGVAGAAITLWVTFVPCFLWIFAGAPYIEWLSAQPRLRGALLAITAAVVGVILNLALWFALNVAFSELDFTNLGPLQILYPVWTSIDWKVMVLTLLSAALLMKFKWNIMLVLTVCASGGVILPGL
ncbi:MAG: chromate efflux transporter [Pseudomonadota bacterium]